MLPKIPQSIRTSTGTTSAKEPGSPASVQADPDRAKTSLASRRARSAGQGRIALDQDGFHRRRSGTVGEHADDVASIPSAQAEQPRLCRRHGIEGLVEPALDYFETASQRAGRIVVGVMPSGPVPHLTSVAQPAVPRRAQSQIWETRLGAFGGRRVPAMDGLSA